MAEEKNVASANESGQVDCLELVKKLADSYRCLVRRRELLRQQYGKPSKRSGMSGKSGADSAERTIRIFSKAGYFAKSAEKSWFVIGKVMACCIFTVNSAMFPSQKKTSGTASIRNCASGWRNIRT